MGRDHNPVPGQWYESLDDEEIFQVLSIDEDAELIELQYEDGDVEEIDYETWQELDLDLTEEPEGWSGPDDDDEDDEELDEDDDDDDWDDEDDDDDEDEDEDGYGRPRRLLTAGLPESAGTGTTATGPSCRTRRGDRPHERIPARSPPPACSSPACASRPGIAARQGGQGDRNASRCRAPATACSSRSINGFDALDDRYVVLYGVGRAQGLPGRDRRRLFRHRQPGRARRRRRRRQRPDLRVRPRLDRLPAARHGRGLPHPRDSSSCPTSAAHSAGPPSSRPRT